MPTPSGYDGVFYFAAPAARPLKLQKHPFRELQAPGKRMFALHAIKRGEISTIVVFLNLYVLIFVTPEIINLRTET